MMHSPLPREYGGSSCVLMCFRHFQSKYLQPSKAANLKFFTVTRSESSSDGRCRKQDYFRFTNLKIERVAAVRPAFLKDGTITAANASKLNDGAAALVVVSEEFSREQGLTPLAR